MKGIIKRWTAVSLLCGTIAGCAGTAPAAPVTPTAPEPVTSAVVVQTVVAAVSDPGIDEAWADFRAQRNAHLQLAADTLLACADAKPKERSPDCQRRRDSFEVAYGLSAMYRLTHDPRYLDAADAAIDAKAVGRVDRLGAYGASFFLALATEREQTKRRTDLHAAAANVAARLEAWLTDADDYEFAQRSMFGNEENAALVLARLWDWAELTADGGMRDRLRSLTERRFVGVEMDSWCPQTVDCEPENFEFLPPCLQRASAVLAVMPSERSNPWLEAFLAKQSELEPMTLSQLGTHQSLNFTRAIALWRVFEATGDTAYRRKYVEHVQTGMTFLGRQDEIDPWHAAFAVHALSMSIEG